MTPAVTRLACVLGQPVGHSISPAIHNAAFRSLGVNALYVRCAVPAAGLRAALQGLRVLGALGANVTIPHKVAVVGLLDGLTPEAEAVGAVNTLFFRDGALVGDNTDATGLDAVLRGDLGVGEGDEVLLVGTGGAARAAALALGRIGTRIRVRGRRPEAVAGVVALARAQGAADGSGRPRLIINATPVGIGAAPVPDEVLEVGPGQTVFDMVYAPLETPVVAAARRRGAEAHDGRAMLVAQAARTFERWTDRPAPTEVMQRAAEAALEPASPPAG